jgi:hypothetical protein
LRSSYPPRRARSGGATAERQTRRGGSGEAARTACLLPLLEEKGGKGCARQAAHLLGVPYPQWTGDAVLVEESDEIAQTLGGFGQVPDFPPWGF